MAGQEYDISYKVLMVGDSGVGKTCIIKNLMGHNFSPLHNATIGIDFVRKVFELDGARVQLEIWDTAGQERFRTITRFQYRGARGLMLVYDVTDRNSFNMLNYWLETIDKEIDRDNREPVPVVIVANKRDLDHLRAITTKQGRKAADDNLVYAFVETSAKLGENVCVAFKQLAQAITEINNPKLMDGYLTPEERKDKYTQRYRGISLAGPALSTGSSKPNKALTITLCFPSSKKDNKDSNSMVCCKI